MATIMTPESPAMDPRPAGDLRLSAIRANLMPDEVIIARRTEVLRRQVMLALAIVLGLIIAWYVVAWWQTHTSNSDLSDANHRSVALTNQQHQYGDLVSAQNEIATIDSQLKRLMVGDIQWRPMLATLRSAAPSGIALTNIVSTITSGAASAAGGRGSALTDPISVLNRSGKQAVGTLAITGTANDQKSIATYVDNLARVKGLTAPYPASVATATGATSGQLNFTVNVIVTTDALGGRYAVTTGGK